VEARSGVAQLAREIDPLRHLKQHGHDQTAGAFGSGGFGAVAEGAARFFGTPGYII
jgi:hypothetical protein